jgi:hypothetical protein
MTRRVIAGGVLVGVAAIVGVTGMTGVGAVAQAQPPPATATANASAPPDAPPVPPPQPPPHLAPQPAAPPKMVRMVDGKTPVIDAPISDVSVVSSGGGGTQHYVQIATRLAQRAFFCKVYAGSRMEAEQIRANITSPATQWVYCRGKTSTREGDPRYFVHLELRLSNLGEGQEFIVMGRP